MDIENKITEIFYPIIPALESGRKTVNFSIFVDQLPLAERLGRLFDYKVDAKTVERSTAHLEGGDSITVYFRGLDCHVTFTKL